MELTAIQTRLQTLVQGVPLMLNRPVLIEDKGNLVNQLEQTLQTMSLAVVVALSSGENKSAVQTRVAWEEVFEIVIHRGQLDTDDVPSSLEVYEQIRDKLQGAPLDPNARVCSNFNCLRHDLRDTGDGAYARVLNVSVKNTTP